VNFVRRVIGGARCAGAGGTHDSEGFETGAGGVDVGFPSWVVFVVLGLKKLEIFGVIDGALMALVVVVEASAGGII